MELSISKIADEYEKIKKDIIEQREKLENEINKLKESLNNTYSVNIYHLLYFRQYGNYKEWSEKLSKELRKRR